jgi:hypothetical protein
MNLLEIDALCKIKSREKVGDGVLIHALTLLGKDIALENRESLVLSRMIHLLVWGLHTHEPLEVIVKKDLDTFADSVFFIKRHLEKYLNLERKPEPIQSDLREDLDRL